MSVSLRFKKTGNKFSAYLDIYQNRTRSYEFIRMYVSQDYSVPLKDENGVILIDPKGNKKYLKPSPVDKIKLEFLRKLCLQRELQIKNHEYGFVDTSLSNTCIRDYVERIRKEIQNNSYNVLVTHLEVYFGKNVCFSKLNDSSVRSFVVYLKESGLSRNTQFYYYSQLCSLLNRAKRDRIIVVNPCNSLSRNEKPKSEQSKRCFLTEEEIRVLFNTPIRSKSRQVKEAFMFACLTGLRISDVLRIKPTDIVDNVLQYRQQKVTQEFHYLPLPKEVNQILESIKPDPRQQLIFWELKRKVKTDQRLIILKEWTELSGINKKITWHVARHTFATLLLTYGTDIYTVSKLLGHSSVNITERYGKIVNHKKVDAINNLPSVLTLNTLSISQTCHK